MLRRGALALPRLPALRLSVRISRRAVVVVAVGGLALALAYVAARATPIFALRTVEIAGASAQVEAQVRKALASIVGTSLVSLDPSEVEARVRAVPSVRSAHVDRAFPHTLAVRVDLERPLAVMRDGRRAWLVSETGRVVVAIEPTERGNLPRIRTDLTGPPRVGATLRDGDVRTLLAVLRALPARFPVPVLYGEVRETSVTLVLRGGVEVQLGPPDAVEPKLRAAAAVLAALEPDDLAAVAYVDVSVPGHVVAAGNAQLPSEG